MAARKPRRCKKCGHQIASRWRRRYCSRDCEKGWMVPAKGPRPSRTAMTTQHFLLGVALTERSDPATVTHGKPRGRSGLMSGQQLDLYLGDHLAEPEVEDEAYRQNWVHDVRADAYDSTVAALATPEQNELLAVLAGD